jgi:predicted nucleic-acid-binding Zn-ribbon protein
VVLAEMGNNVLSNYEKVKIQITGHESKKILRLQLEKNDGAEGI